MSGLHALADLDEISEEVEVVVKKSEAKSVRNHSQEKSGKGNTNFQSFVHDFRVNF